MDELRLALLVAGIAVIGGVYLREWLARRRAAAARPRSEPVLAVEAPPAEGGEAPADAGPAGGDGPGAGAAQAEAGPRPAGWADLVVVHVRAREGAFEGPELARAFDELGLAWGAMEIFHHRDAEGRLLYSVANAREPGTFPEALTEGFRTPALTLFLTLPGHPDAAAGVEALLAAADRLAARLGGELRDRDRRPLDEAGRALLRARAAEAG
ncbi:cell division protein ZipA C-terminal FtsZ-binding domain-containing protein [Inmirania thermothiophila]|uniref:Cell division protein ZipA n=1 Tax=Inmirania thermothiophila TaxID=1750597 RepID=A0A3N1Y3T6_9GAMM|nr:cell division protein ZipA C-terminal FtsZ-binding domain-containing protein [Inmirania thermothiophila]ROR32252.1 ZipA-like protein with FtsZ-binding domain [Inmirania thermothiophila]